RSGSDDPSGARGTVRYPPHVTRTLISWFLTNVHHPYPTSEDKAALARQTGLKLNQVCNWFTNQRKR
ncbi:unnamed protein product, partial [Phaeothamnion confervicola]